MTATKTIQITTLTIWITITITLTTAKDGIDTSVCTTNKVTDATPLPALRSTWSTEIRWLSMTDRRVFVVREDFDRERGKTAVRVSVPLLATDAKLLYDLYNGEISIFPDATKRDCQVHKPDGSYYSYDGLLWLSSLYEMTRHIDKSFEVQYKGQTTIDGVQLEHFSACIYEFEINSTASYNLYYAGDMGSYNATWQIPHLPVIGPAQTVPFLITIDIKGQMGSKVIDYEMRGEISRFDRLPIFDDDTFLPPPGTWCEGLSITSIPSFPSSFSMVSEIVNLDYNKVTYEKLYFDVKRKLIRWDWKETDGSLSSEDTDPFSSVYDYNIGIKFKVDRNLLSCDKPAFISRRDPYSVASGADYGPFGQQFKMASSAVVFHTGSGLYQKVGRKTIRGVDCDVYVGRYYDDADMQNNTVQWYFTQRRWTIATDNVVDAGALFRMDVWRGGSDKPHIRNILEYQTVQPFSEVFDLSPCYTSQQKIRFVLLIQVQNPQAFALVSHRVLKDRVLSILAELITEDNRFSDIELDYDGANRLYAYASLLERVGIENPLVNHTELHPMKAAFKFLESSVRGNSMFLVNNIANQPVTLTPQQIYRLNDSRDFATLPPTSPPTTLVPVAPPKRTTPGSTIPTTAAATTTSTTKPSNNILTTIIQGPTPCQCPKTSFPATQSSSLSPQKCPSPTPCNCPTSGPSLAQCRPLCLSHNVCQCPTTHPQVPCKCEKCPPEGKSSSSSSSSSSASSSSSCVGKDSSSSGDVTVAALVGGMFGFLALGLVLGLVGFRIYVVFKAANPRRILSNDDLNNEY